MLQAGGVAGTADLICVNRNGAATFKVHMHQHAFSGWDVVSKQGAAGVLAKPIQGRQRGGHGRSRLYKQK